MQNRTGPKCSVSKTEPVPNAHFFNYIILLKHELIYHLDFLQLQNVFHFKGKNVFGFRLSNTSDIIVLDELTNEKPLLEEAEKWCNPYTILFHSKLSIALIHFKIP